MSTEEERKATAMMAVYGAYNVVGVKGIAYTKFEHIMEECIDSIVCVIPDGEALDRAKKLELTSTDAVASMLESVLSLPVDQAKRVAEKLKK